MYEGGGEWTDELHLCFGRSGGVVASEGGPTLFMFSDRQEKDRGLANLGFIVARDSPQLRPLLKTWWLIHPSQDAERYDFEPHMEQAVMWHMQLGDEYVPVVVKDRMQRVVQVSDSPWAPIQSAGWLTHVTSEEDRASWGGARDIFFRVVLRELNMTHAQWSAHVQDMVDGCNIMPIDLAALDADIVAYKKSLETLSEEELWRPRAPPILGLGEFEPFIFDH